MKQVSHLFLGALVFLSGLAKADDDSNSKLEQAWKEDTLTVEMALSYQIDRMVVKGKTYHVPNGGCYQDVNTFDGCVLAVQKVGKYLKPEVTLIPVKDLAHDEYRGAKVLRQIHNLALIEIPAQYGEKYSAMKPRDRVARVVADRNDTLAAGEEMLALSKQIDQDPIGFREIILQLDKMKPATVPEAKLAVAVIDGFNLATDAHSHLNLNAEFDPAIGGADPSFSGIGIEILYEKGITTVARVIDGGPSVNILQQGDVIATADGVVLNGMEQNAVVAKLRGTTGTIVKVGIVRGLEQKTVDIKRGKIEQKNVEPLVVSDFKQKNGYIRLHSFMHDESCDQIKAAIKNMDKNVSGYILDLRNNGGGLLNQAGCIGQVYAGRYPIAYEKDLKTGKVEQTPADNRMHDAVTNKPLVVLINGYSASASEIVSGALQGLGRAWVVGERSFGKASVQEPTPFPLDENFSLYRTIARFYVPVFANGASLSMRTNQRTGVVPDFTVLPRPNLSEDDAFVMREAELYPYALSAETEKWQQVREGKQAVIQNCLDQGKRSDKTFASRAGYDYQLLKAQEVLACETEQAALL